MPLPLMSRLRQRFPRPAVADVTTETARQLESLALQDQIRPEQSVAIPVGSRGVANIAEITRAVCTHVRELGANPFIVPAMGSHGGASADGQRQVLEGLGVTEDFCRAEIRSSMETVVVTTIKDGIPVHFDRHAFEADHVIIMGRVKPHTMFVGDIESGLHKMMLIGLGKHAGALTCHRAIKSYSFDEIIRAVADVVLKRCHVIAGLAIVENAYDETALIEAVPPDQFYDREAALLKQAVEWMPRLPCDQIDLLIVDRIGKNISGTGMDTNIVGRKYNDHVAMPGDRCACKRIFVRSLTKETHGNACGIGLAEFTTQRVVEQINVESTRINCITSGHPTAGMLPLIYSNDRAAIEDALLTIGLTEPEHARVVQIADTLHLGEVLVSPACLNDGLSAQCEVVEPPREMVFDQTGMLADVTAERHGETET